MKEQRNQQPVEITIKPEVNDIAKDAMLSRLSLLDAAFADLDIEGEST